MGKISHMRGDTVIITNLKLSLHLCFDELLLVQYLMVDMGRTANKWKKFQKVNSKEEHKFLFKAFFI